MLGALASSELAEVLRTSDAMIHAAQNEPCSNALLEALASGLPVLFRRSGGNAELAEGYGIGISEDIGRDIDELRGEYGQLRERILEDRSKFLISHAAERYAEAFRRAVEVVGTGRTARLGFRST
jgi:glycosyltransferase involved in cell wall biosynthesis